ncbi:hypothetical protein KY337_00960, partial [Candidatus Woesearchaeota archaeon]|nr:hypothetical protein [Candidatus Woesearchaeota archaeon]
EREVVSTFAPKKCRLTIKGVDEHALENVFFHANRASQTPMKFIKIDRNEFHIEIGSDFKRCSDCNSFVSRLRTALNTSILDKRTTCTMKEREREFCYEDYFD